MDNKDGGTPSLPAEKPTGPDRTSGCGGRGGGGIRDDSQSRSSWRPAGIRRWVATACAKRRWTCWRPPPEPDSDRTPTPDAVEVLHLAIMKASSGGPGQSTALSPPPITTSQVFPCGVPVLIMLPSLHKNSDNRAVRLHRGLVRFASASLGPGQISPLRVRASALRSPATRRRAWLRGDTR